VVSETTKSAMIAIEPLLPSPYQSLPEMSIPTYAKLITPYQGFPTFFL